MAFYYIEEDGKTVTLFSSVEEFKAIKQEDPNEEKHTDRMFAIHPNINTLISRDPLTQKYIYDFKGSRRHY